MSCKLKSIDVFLRILSNFIYLYIFTKVPQYNENRDYLKKYNYTVQFTRHVSDTVSIISCLQNTIRIIRTHISIHIRYNLYNGLSFFYRMCILICVLVILIAFCKQLMMGKGLAKLDNIVRERVNREVSTYYTTTLEEIKKTDKELHPAV